MSRQTRLTSLAAAGVAAGWVLITGLNQHPNRSFDWARKYDSSGMLIGNWRFFAPNPAVHDFRVAHRLLWKDGSVSDWEDTRVVPPRRWYSPVFFPERRRDKGITDISGGLTEMLTAGGEKIEKSAAYRVLSLMVRARVEEDHHGDDDQIEGYQFAVGRDAGFDDTEDAQVFLASGLIPWAEPA